MLIPAIVLIAAAAPLVLSVVQLWREGDYVTQRYLWRSAYPREVE